MTIFEKIAAGQIPCHKVWEDAEFLAFLDIRPVAVGHTLLIPKKQVDPLFSMDEASLQRMIAAAKRVAELLKSKISCQRICMAVVGFEVPHAHMHLIPAQSVADFPWPVGRVASQQELAEALKKIIG